MIRRLLIAILIGLLAAPPAFADLSVVNGAYTHALRGTDVSAAFIQDVTIADPTTGSRVSVSSGGMGVNILSGSVSFTGELPTGNNVIGHVICDSGCSSSPSPSFGSSFPSTGTPIGGTDGTNLQPIRIRTSTPGSSDNGVVTRPLMPCDGTNCMPAGDSSARSIHVTVDNGSGTVTESGNLTLGSSTIAETVSVTYGEVKVNPSTMTLGTDGNGMRWSLTRSGMGLVQMNATASSSVTNFASATSTNQTSVVSAPGSGLRFCLTGWAMTNASSTDTNVVLVDDVGGANIQKTDFIRVPGSGGNNAAQLGTPICFSENKAAGFRAMTAVSTINVTFWGFKTKE